MLLKVVCGQGEWLVLNGNCRFIHLKELIQEKCAAWPEGATLDLCDIESGTVMNMHTLGPWDMATPCFTDVDTQKKIFVPVAMVIENTIIKSVEPMLDQFAEQFPEPTAILHTLVNTKIRVATSTKPVIKSLLTPSPKPKTKSPKPEKKKKERTKK